jgi:glucose-1-phosphate adenylyltransferase
MDYSKMLRFHLDRNADATLADARECRWPTGRRFGIVGVDEHDRVREFQEKPAVPPCIPGSPDLALASMGIYIFKADVLVKALEDDAANVDSQHDFGKNIIPSLIAPKAVYSYRFYDENKKAAKYWRDIGTLDAYYDASMDLCQISPEFNLYDPEWPLRTYQPQAPPAKFVFAERAGAAGRRSTPSCRTAASSRAAASSAAFSAPTCACTASATSRTPS